MSSLPLPTLNTILISGEYGHEYESDRNLKSIGNASSHSLRSVPNEIKHKPLKLVAAGGGVVLFCTVDDELYYSPTTNLELMRLSLQQQPASVPLSGLFAPKIKLITCCYNCCAILTEEGQLYGCGYNSNNVLTKHYKQNPDVATMINTGVGTDVLKHVQKMIGRFYAIALFTHSNDVYIVGKGFSDDFEKLVIRDNVVNENKKFCHASFGDSHSLVLTTGGELYLKGSNNYGQLGNSELSSTSTFFLVTEIGKRIKFAECGYYHTIAITVDNEIYGVGWNAVGELGNNTVGDQRQWVKATFITPCNDSITYFSVGYQQAFIRLQSGSIFCCGFNSYGGLGLEDTESRSTYVPFMIKNQSTLHMKPLCGGHFTLFFNDPFINGFSKYEKHLKEKLCSILKQCNNCLRYDLKPFSDITLA
ncbi:hypothetical protein C9374_013837 [Naegleria lovaniensis]|uniref:Uncharacterized protein n=1 Tax=Naegleria lovaniensis TaxID=51637 RepID=A0AA88KUL9_NAELO|nr:uncharacterized protein C9374_013837 [Naegleria lovaniensis]KAG2389277.1 hypothetical protein C9374_013837 [Naegleria lovaniensis]